MESCLTLDVYTPAVAKLPGSGSSPLRLRSNASLPVMVFIEGGGFLVGDKYQQGIYDGRKLVDKQNVVLVNINYRLGVLGFLHHPYLRDKESGEELMNFGLRDQLEALRWIQENIHSFGGDPKRVTLVGESAGAMSICAHLASPVARQLFSNVIMESLNCDGLFIWMPQRFASDWGRRYVRAVFGRIRACGTLPEPDRTVYKESQNDCSESDTASVATVIDRCSDIFLGFDEQHLHLRNVTSFVQLLPLEWLGGCDGIYRGCEERTFPSGLAFDDGLLRCALRLDAGHVWVNQFGITERHALEKSSYMEELMGMSFTGMPLPPHLPWAPVIDPRGPKDLHYAVGGGLLTLPQKVLMEDESPLHLGSITAGFNRDEGTLFSLLVPHFLGYVPRFSGSAGMEDSVYRDIMEQLACPDYGPACRTEGCHTDQSCGGRLAKIMKEYAGEARPSRARGSCCSKDPNTLRLQRILTDYLFVCPTLRFLETMEKRSNAELRLYEFDADDELPSTVPDLKNTLGAFHVSELFFVFGNEDGPGGNLPLQGGAFGLGLGFTKQDVVISKKMSNSWGALVRHEELPEWPLLNTSNRAIRFALDVPGNVDYISRGMIRKLHHCKFFDELKKEMSEDLK